MSALVQQAQHSRLAPSSSYQWVVCPASIGLQELYPEGDTEDSRAGEASHWVGSTCLTLRDITPDMLIGQDAPNGEKISVEMAESAAMHVNHVNKICTEFGLFTGLRVEQSVHIPRIHPDCWGTPDADVFDSSRGVLHVWDYKYGWGIVEEYENWQGICYAIGALDRILNCGNPNISDLYITVKIHIVQPRPYHKDGKIRTWSIPATDLRNYANILHHSAAKALEEHTETISGPHCRYCSARHVCEAAQKSSYTAIDMIAQNKPHELDNVSLGATITALRRAKEMAEWQLAAYESQALTNIRRGILIPGYGAESGQGRQVWNRPKPEVIALGDMYEINLRKPEDVITPKQAMDAGIDETVINAYSEIPKTGLKLVPVDKLAKKVFSK